MKPREWWTITGSAKGSPGQHDGHKAESDARHFVTARFKQVDGHRSWPVGGGEFCSRTSSAPAGVGESQGSNSASDSSLSTGCRSAPATAQTIPALTTLYSFTGVNDDGLLPYGTLAIGPN
jgi:hypothetical protein